MSKEDGLLAKIDITRTRIVRALLCAAGLHDAWKRRNTWNGYTDDAVHMSIQTDDHGKVYVAVCEHCRALYVRRRGE